MRKPVYIYTSVTFLLLIFAVILRTVELNTAFDRAAHLARFLPVSAVLIALSCAAAVFYLCFSLKAGAGLSHASYHVSFRPATAIPLVVSVIAMVAVLWAAVLCFAKYRTDSASIVYCILAVLAFVASAADVYLKLNAFRGRSGREEFFAMSAGVVFVCFLLIVYYKEHAAIPSVTLTMYDFLGLCAAAAAMYYLAGFSVGSAHPGQTLFFSGVAVFFCCIAFLGAESPIFRLFYLFIAAKLFIDSELLLRSGDFQPASSTDAEA